jgi:eukaryotic-like serine/threonine-protein kinase
MSNSCTPSTEPPGLPLIITSVIRLTERFVLEREIGSGGMSRVFLGRDEVLDRPVAIKILNADLGRTDIGSRFRREGRTAARLSHPNIVQVYDAGEGEFEGRETSYIVMEYVSGGDLKDLIDERGVLSGAELVRLSGAAAGLGHAHERGVIHRDIKPHNILITGSGYVKVTDFGVARALDATYVTRTGTYLGTALYSSPEQLRGEGVTPKSDVYSLGVTLYHAATGQTPFTGTPIEVASQHVSSDPTPPRRLNDAMSASLEALILGCLEKDPASRPTADEVRLGLLEAVRGVHDTRAYDEPPVMEPAGEEGIPTAAPPPAGTQSLPGRTVYAGSRQARTRGVLAALALAAVVALIGAIVAPTLFGGGEQSANVPEQGGQNPDNPSGGGQGGEQNRQLEGPPSRQSDAQPDSQQTPSGQTDQDQAGGLTEEAAARTVRDVYTLAAEGNYGASYDLLSEGFKQSRALTQAEWGGQFDTLRSIRFVQGPDAQVSGDTATVTGVTVAEHTFQTERNTVTWILVNEGGGWKVDDLQFRDQEILQA